MKVLILVPVSGGVVFQNFQKMQSKTWDSIDHENIKTVYYKGEGDNTFNGKIFSCDEPEEYERHHRLHKKAIDACIEMDWDICFRTSAASYINKEMLYSKCLTLPTTKLYAGKCGHDNHKNNFVSGAGIFYSKDIAKILSKKILRFDKAAEDVLIAHILKINKIKITQNDQSRIDIADAEIPKGRSYHYRIKSDDRSKDILCMHQLHRTIINESYLINNR